MTVNEFIRRQRQRIGLTQRQLAAAVGVTRPSVQQWERPGGTAPRRALQPVVAEVLGVSIAELMSASVDSDNGQLRQLPQLPRVPILPPSEASAYLTIDNFRDLNGRPTTAVTVPIKRRTFAMVVEGESMASALGDTFTEGSIIVVEPTLPPAPGDYVIVVEEPHPAMLRQLVYDFGAPMLKPLNARYPPRPLAGAHVVGVVRACMKQFR